MSCTEKGSFDFLALISSLHLEAEAAGSSVMELYPLLSDMFLCLLACTPLLSVSSSIIL